MWLWHAAPPPHSGKCPVNFPPTEIITWWVSTLGTVGSSLPRRHHSFACFSQTRNPNTRVPCLNYIGILLVKPNCYRFSLMRTAEHTLIYKDVINIRGGSINDLILLHDSIDNRLHFQGCNIKPKSQTGETILLPLDLYCLEWPQGLFDVYLQIGPAQVQHCNFWTLLLPLP